LLRASNLRLKSARATGATASSFWPTPTYKGSGNRAFIKVGPEGLRFQHDLNQVDQECSSSLDAVLGHPDRLGLDPCPVPVFAPAPGEFREWGEILDSRPGLKPCLYRPSDGLAHGLDRAAAAGNGVVPMAAARAFEVLKKELLNGV
jgi:hypothetical protein